MVRSEIGSDASLEETPAAKKSEHTASVNHKKQHKKPKAAASEAPAALPANALPSPGAKSADTPDEDEVAADKAATAASAHKASSMMSSGTDVNAILDRISAMQIKLGKKQGPETKNWGKTFIWTKNVSAAATGPSYFHCLKRFGPYAMWELPVGSPYSPPNQPCTAFYVKKFLSTASGEQDYIDNGICTRDDWCLNGLKISSKDSRTHGSSTSGRTAKEAVKYDVLAGSTRSVRVSFNTAVTGFPADGSIGADSWQCIKQLSFPGGSPLPDMGLEVTSDESLCAQIDLGWLE